MHWWDEAVVVAPSDRDRVDTDPSDPPSGPHDSDAENTAVDIIPPSDSSPKVGASARERTGSGG